MDHALESEEPTSVTRGILSSRTQECEEPWEDVYWNAEAEAFWNSDSWDQWSTGGSQSWPSDDLGSDVYYGGDQYDASPPDMESLTTEQREKMAAIGEAEILVAESQANIAKSRRTLSEARDAVRASGLNREYYNPGKP